MYTYNLKYVADGESTVGGGDPEMGEVRTGKAPCFASHWWQC